MLNPPPRRVLIIGAGQAGGEVALELRRQKYAGEIILIGAEPYPPYRRPPLSKDYLAGQAGQGELWLVPSQQWAQMNIDLRLGQRVMQIDRAARTMTLETGVTLDFDALVLSTGGSPRPLPINGADHPAVHFLRTMADADQLRAAAHPGQHAIIVGGGFIGLETASTLRGLGLRVTVLEAAPRLLARVTSPWVSTFFERIHREAGVDVRTGCTLTAISPAATGTLTLELADGDQLCADLVIAGIGLVPDTTLAEAAGLDVDDGIVVDAYGATCDPAIFAAGDCTRHPNPTLARVLRLESQQNAITQARCVARNLVGHAQPYDVTPWFWSNQFDIKWQIVGIADGYDQCILRGNLASGRDFSAFYLRQGRLLAADVVNRAQEFMLARRLIEAAACPDPEHLADESRPLRDLLKR